MHATLRDLRWTWAYFKVSPLILRAYLVFAVLATVVGFASILPAVGARLVPYTGWGGLQHYMWTLFFAGVVVFTRQRRPLIGVWWILGLFALFGLEEAARHLWWSHAWRAAPSNPWITYHPFRPVIEFALPAVWLALLASPPLRRWVKTSDKPKRFSLEELVVDRRSANQFSLAELMRLIAVLAVITAVTVKLVQRGERLASEAKPAGVPAQTAPMGSS